jgi:DNA oxidative demethylase
MNTYISLYDQINVTYEQNFFSKYEADIYYALFESHLKYNSDEDSKIILYGKSIKIPREQVAYGDVGVFYTFSGNKVTPRCWNSDECGRKLLLIKNKIEQYTGESFNFVLVNRYRDGNSYIGFHSDDEKDLDKTSSIIGVSLGCERDFLFKPKKSFVPKNILSTISINLSHGSLTQIKSPTNEYWQHSIPKRTNSKKPRISLTFRCMKIL